MSRKENISNKKIIQKEKELIKKKLKKNKEKTEATIEFLSLKNNFNFNTNLKQILNSLKFKELDEDNINFDLLHKRATFLKLKKIKKETKIKNEIRFRNSQIKLNKEFDLFLHDSQEEDKSTLSNNINQKSFISSIKNNNINKSFIKEKNNYKCRLYKSLSDQMLLNYIYNNRKKFRNSYNINKSINLDNNNLISTKDNTNYLSSKNNTINAKNFFNEKKNEYNLKNKKSDTINQEKSKNKKLFSYYSQFDKYKKMYRCQSAAGKKYFKSIGRIEPFKKTKLYQDTQYIFRNFSDYSGLRIFESNNEKKRILNKSFGATKKFLDINKDKGIRKFISFQNPEKYNFLKSKFEYNVKSKNKFMMIKNIEENQNNGETDQNSISHDLIYINKKAVPSNLTKNGSVIKKFNCLLHYYGLNNKLNNI